MLTQQPRVLSIGGRLRKGTSAGTGVLCTLALDTVDKLTGLLVYPGPDPCLPPGPPSPSSRHQANPGPVWQTLRVGGTQPRKRNPMCAIFFVEVALGLVEKRWQMAIGANYKLVGV